MGSMVIAVRQHVGCRFRFLLLPVMYGTYRSYQIYFGWNAAEHSSLGMAKAATQDIDWKSDGKRIDPTQSR